MSEGGRLTPVSIVTGFLGAGKTTLLSQLLRADHRLKIALIQNEMSAAPGIEASRMVGPGGEAFEEWVELANGCVCCTVRDELSSALEELLRRRGGFDYILIETTGMADPTALAESFWLDDELESPIRLDGIVTVADCVNLSSQLREEEACRQLGCADVIILNKAEEIPPSTLRALQAEIRNLNSLAPLLPTSHSRVALESILFLNAYDTSRNTRWAAEESCLHSSECDCCSPRFPPPKRSAHKGEANEQIDRLNGKPSLSKKKASLIEGETSLPTKEAALPQGEASPPAGDRGLPNSEGLLPNGEANGKASLPNGEGSLPMAEASTADVKGSFAVGSRSLHRDPAFGCVTLVEHGPLSLPKLRVMLAALLWEREGDPPPEVFRAKGVFEVEGEESFYAMQAVNSTYELVPSLAWSEEEAARGNRAVFIGRHLHEPSLRAALRECRVSEGHPGQP